MSRAALPFLRPIAVLGLGLCALLALPSCATTGSREATNARFRMADLDQAVAEVRASLVGSRFIRETPAQGEVLLRAEPLTNLSLDRFTVAEEQMVVSRVLSDTGVQVALREAGIRLLDSEVTRPADATHRFEAHIRSIAREGSTDRRESDARRDAYLLEYQITERATSAIVWQASTEVARAARGLVID